MIDLDKIYQYLQSADGVNQLRRGLPALDPGSVQLDGRTKRDIIKFLFQLSKQICFYSQDNAPQADWSGLFGFLKSAGGDIMSEDELNQLMVMRKDWPPQVALLMTFLQLYAIAQKDLNKLVTKHLNYYYERVLQLKHRGTQADQVHVTFELNKSATDYSLKKGALLDAGKDSAGQPLRFSIDSDLIINRAAVGSLKSLYFDHKDGRAIAFIADDATLVKSSLSSGWRPFGGAQLALAPEVRNMKEASLGFAVASPALLLAEGARSITVTIHLTAGPGFLPADLPSFLPACFDISLTGDKGWTSPVFFQGYSNAGGNISLTLTTNLTEKDPPVVPFNDKLHGGGYVTAWPVLRCVVKPYSFQLENLDKFVVTGVDLAVGANGLKNLVLQNDESIQPVNKPILPFASVPRIGSNFYIGSSEAFSKSLESVTVKLNWKDPPADFQKYYEGYDNPQINYGKFTCNVFILGPGGFKIINANIQPLFDPFSSSSPRVITNAGSFFDAEVQLAGYTRNPYLGPIKEYSAGTSQGFVSIQLAGPTHDNAGDSPSYAPFEAFGHTAFPTIYAVQAFKRSAHPEDDTKLLPNQPYTPTLQSVSLDYTARESFTPSLRNHPDQFFMLDAFGNAESNANIPARLIPELPVPAAALTGRQVGVLYAGIDNCTAPEILSLLFQMESGSMPGSTLLEKENIVWSYLQDNKWQKIPSASIQLETTGNFQKPGIIRVSVAADADIAATAMPGGFCWLRIVASQHADGASDVTAIVAQAASATRIVNESGDITTLQPGVIKQLVPKASAIKKVTQDFPSFNGLSAETASDFYVRTSERLRHRNRKVAGWDYERIVLQNFPDLFKAKCLSYTNYTNDFNNLKPGSLKLVVIPDVRRNKAGNRLQPVSNLARLNEIKQFILNNNPNPFLNADTVFVSNPVYETLLVDCKVAFMPGKDPGFYRNQLEEEIRRFLSPWAYEEGKDITFGGKIYRSEILSFIESRNYVDYVINFQLYHRYSGTDTTSGIGCMTIGVDFIVAVKPTATIGSSGGSGTYAGATIGVDFVIGIPVDVATTTRPDAILASNVRHRIDTLQEGSFECSGVTALGIGEMIVGLDFIPL